MDILNLKIIKLLQENSRRTFVDIGKEVGLSAPAVAERVQKLEMEGVIERFTVAINYSKMGYHLKAIISFKVRTGLLLKFLDYINGLDEIKECHRITGDDCVIMNVIVKSSKNLEELIDKLYHYGEPKTSIVLSSPISHKAIF